MGVPYYCSRTVWTIERSGSRPGGLRQAEGVTGRIETWSASLIDRHLAGAVDDPLTRRIAQDAGLLVDADQHRPGQGCCEPGCPAAPEAVVVRDNTGIQQQAEAGHDLATLRIVEVLA